jgi:cell wall-associated NlpC family hydrolase
MRLGRYPMKARYRILIFLAGTWIFIASGYSCFAQAAAPAKSTNKPQAAGQAAPNTAPATTYEIRIVEKGDTLYRIAQDEGTTVKALLSLNKLQNNRLQIGQKLKVPLSQKTPPETKAVAPPKTILVDAAPETLDVANATVEVDDPGEESLRLRLVKAARELLGTRYRWAGVSAQTGFDCSGLVQQVFSYFEIDLPRSSKEQYKIGEKIDKDELEAGDLVFFSSGGKQPTHVGIYVGDNQFLHAARKAKGVVISDMNQSWYVRRFLGARRMIELWLDKLGASQEPEVAVPSMP